MASMSSSSPWSPFQFTNVSTPLNNINPNLVNVHNSNNPSNFGSDETNRQFGLSGVSSNIAAANRSIMKGGAKKTLRRKIKNIVNKYKKMSRGRKMTLRRIKKRFASIVNRGKSKSKSRSRKNVTRRSRRHTKQHGGTYHQYMGNVPNTPSYSTGVIVSAAHSALAMPVPFKPLSNCVNCVDNYNHNTNKGFQFW